MSVHKLAPAPPIAAEPATITFTLNDAPSPPHARRMGLVLVGQGFDRARGCHTLVYSKEPPDARD